MRFFEGLFWALFSALITPYLETHKRAFIVMSLLLFIDLYIVAYIRKAIFLIGLHVFIHGVFFILSIFNPYYKGKWQQYLYFIAFSGVPIRW